MGGISTFPMRGNDDSWTVHPDGSPAHKAKSLYLDSDGTPQKIAANNGTLSFNGNAIAGGGSVSDTLQASQNNYSPPNVGGANVWILTPFSGGSTITGLVIMVPTYIWNAGASDSISFSHQSGSSQSANRLFCPGAVTNVLGPYSGCLVLPVNGGVGFFS